MQTEQSKLASVASGRTRPRIAAMLVCLFAVIPAAHGQLTEDRLDSSLRVDNANQTKREAVHIIDNIWWVGHSKVGAFLLTSAEGHILIDTTSTEQGPWTVESIVNAGFELTDIRYILNTHPHEEHMGGMAMFRKLLPHAQLLASKETAEVMATGGKTDFRYIVERDETDLFEPFVVDGLIRHGDKVTVGHTTLVAHLTPGHTEGATSWTTVATENGRDYDVLIFGGMSASGADRTPLIDNDLYPEIADDFQSSFDYLRTLDCDVYLYPRAASIKLDEKIAAREQNDGHGNPFVDPEGCQHYINFYEARFKKQLAEEKAARR